MEHNTFYNDILTDHNMHPGHRSALPGASHSLEGVNPSCGDDITLHLRLEGDTITGGSFEGSGCAISQASVDIMLDLITGKSRAEALRLAELFVHMIQGQATPQQLEELEEAAALQDISHMPARVKCAVLGWHTLQQLLAPGGAEQN